MKPSLRILKLSALLVLVLALQACVPFPHYEVYAPPLTGKVHRNGRPVANATVYYEYPYWGYYEGRALEPFGDRCFYNSILHTTTNSAGEFFIEAPEAFKAFLILVHWRWAAWQICIVDGDAGYQGWYEQVYGLYPREKEHGDYPRGTALDCDLETKPHEEQRGDNLKTKGICTNSKYN